MSGVPVRLRNISQFEFYNTAIDIRVRITRLVTSSAVPKSYRFTFAVPMAQTARSMVYNIVTADAFYPNSEDAVTLRKRHLTLAIADCEQLYQDMQCLLAMGLPVPEVAYSRAPEDEEARRHGQGREDDPGAGEAIIYIMARLHREAEGQAEARDEHA